MKYSAYPFFFTLTLMLAACGGGSSGTLDGTTASAASQAAVSSDTAVSSAGATAAASNTPASTAGTAAPSTTVASSATEVAPSEETASTASEATASSASADATPAAPKIIEYYGDSTVWGYRTEVGGQVAKPAPTAFAEALPNPAAYIVRNEGVNSSTACQLLNGTDSKHQPWASQMAASKASYVFVNHAINDEWSYDVDTYKSCLRSLAKTAKQYGKQMIFETPNPTRDSGSWGLDVYVNAMKEVASQESVPVIDQYKYLTDYLAGQSPYTICPDGLHPTEDVYLMKGKYAAKAFANLFIK